MSNLRNQKKRVVVTGMGIVSCFGTDVDIFYHKLLQGQSGVSMITGFPTDDFSTRFAGEIKDFDPGEYIDKKDARRVDKFIAYAIIAGKKALENASFTLDSSAHDPSKYGVIAGSGMGGMTVFSNNVGAYLEKGSRRISPFFVPFSITNMGGAMLAIDLNFQGPNYSVSTACATGNYSITLAAEHIRKGDADLMICGGSEAPINPIGLGGFCACKALSQRNDDPQAASRPWDKDRDGFVMGEGAALIVLESLEHALKRKATIYAEYLGGAFSCDAYHMTEPSPEGKGVSLCIRNALKDAGVESSQVNYVNAHATSTLLGDMAEIRALKQVLPHPEKVVLNATKSLIGHSISAAAGFEAIATIKAIQTGFVHPTLNLNNPEEGLDFVIPAQQISHKIEVGISNSFGFGGHNATVVFAPFQG